MKGHQHLADQEPHDRYGNFVRDGPDSLLVSDIHAFKSVYGFLGKLETRRFLRSDGKY